jgi:hypothetical protein
VRITGEYEARQKRNVALAAILLFGNASISAAQPDDEVNELNRKLIELYNAGRYADAVPIAQRESRFQVWQVRVTRSILW